MFIAAAAVQVHDRETVDTPTPVRQPSSPPSTARVASVDAYRGFVMLLMLAEIFRSCAVAAALPGSTFWGGVCYEQTHAAWVGASLHDLIQPSFNFIVGMALLFSISRRRSAGFPTMKLAGHVVGRSVLLIVIGVALMSSHPRHVVWMFTDTLAQIGLAFPFAFLIALRPKRDWWIALGGILTLYWLWFVLYPVPSPGFDYATVGVSSDWINTHGLNGFFLHWQKNTNVGTVFDRWFLNLIPRDTPYIGDITGLNTLNFIPTIGTMILGLVAADLLRTARPPIEKLQWLIAAGVALLASGWLLHVLGVCPVVKAVWTPSWVLFSGGWCFLLLAVFYAAVDLGGLTRLAFPLSVLGMNSLVAYAMSHLYPALAYNGIRRVVGNSPFEVLGPAYVPMLYGCAVFAMYWIVLYALYRRRIFVRI